MLLHEGIAVFDLHCACRVSHHFLACRHDPGAMGVTGATFEIMTAGDGQDNLCSIRRLNLGELMRYGMRTWLSSPMVVANY